MNAVMLIFLDLQVDVLERLEIPIVEVQVLYVQIYSYSFTCSDSFVCHIGAETALMMNTSTSSTTAVA